jgi:hypothetical protein
VGQTALQSWLIAARIHGVLSCCRASDRFPILTYPHHADVQDQTQFSRLVTHSHLQGVLVRSHSTTRRP